MQTTIVVREPEGDDKIIYERLRSNPQLAFAMMSTIYEPWANVVPDLQDILKNFPKSFYANYARFALARKKLRGTGYLRMFTENHPRDEFVAYYAKLVRESKQSDKDLASLLSARLWGGGVDVVKNVVAARRKTLKELQDSLQPYYDLRHVSLEERREAIALLRAIKPDSGFAYYPNVLCSLKFALEGIDPMSLELVKREMNEKYYDASEWITIQNGIIPANKLSSRIERIKGNVRPKDHEAWRAFRIRKVAPKSAP